MTLPDNAFDAQDKTQLTAGGSPVAGEFAKGDLVGGSYEIVSFIGAGGMGNVYCVKHAIMQTEYALKTLSAEKVTEVAWRRFQNEAQAIARMNHPNVVAIYNLGFHDGRLPYYVMDILHGKTLSDLLREKGRLETNEALRMFIQVCAGIGYAHKKGIVHRDIKPPNIVLLNKPDPSGATIKIVDFGIAKLSHTKELANQQLTSVGEVCGSPFYMSPEQCEAGKIDARSDIYSLGCTLFEALTGSPPFKGRNAVETMMLHHTGTPPTLKAASGGKDFPPMLEMAVATLLAKAPMDRYQNMERLAQDLQTILQGSETAITPYALPRSEHHDQADMVDQRRTKIGAPSEVASQSRQHFSILTITAALLGMVLVSAAGAWWLSSATPLLQRLKGSQTLEHLYIESTRLSLEDYQLIGTLKNLTVLKTRGCGGNDQDIAAVSDLDKLKEFDLSENAVTVAVAPSLNKLHAHGLKTVKTLSSFLPGEEHDKLRRACPGLLFP